MKVECPVVSLKKYITFVMTGKISPEIIHSKEFEGFAGVNVTILVFSIFNTS
jgi:hypothetical protein